jgi:hypothetical protein
MSEKLLKIFLILLLLSFSEEVYSIAVNSQTVSEVETELLQIKRNTESQRKDLHPKERRLSQSYFHVKRDQQASDHAGYTLIESHNSIPLYLAHRSLLV